MITLDPLLIAIIVIVVLVVLFSVTCIKIVPQAEAAIVERLARTSTRGTTACTSRCHSSTRAPLHLAQGAGVRLPAAARHHEGQRHHADRHRRLLPDHRPKLYTYGIEQPILAIENLSATTLRNLIGDLELDQCLTSRDIVNTKMRQILDEATDPGASRSTAWSSKTFSRPRRSRAPWKSR